MNQATSTPEAADSWSMLGNLFAFGENLNLGDTDPRVIVMRLISIGMGFVSIVMVLLVLSAGARWMTSGGDEEKVKTAQKTLINAVVGLLIMLSAYSIVSFVIRALATGTGSTVFQ